MTAPCGGPLRLVRGGADGRATDHYRFDAEQKRRPRLSSLSRLPISTATRRCPGPPASPGSSSATSLLVLVRSGSRRDARSHFRIDQIACKDSASTPFLLGGCPGTTSPAFAERLLNGKSVAAGARKAGFTDCRYPCRAFRTRLPVGKPSRRANCGGSKDHVWRGSDAVITPGDGWTVATWRRAGGRVCGPRRRGGGR
jgi:hypothetical protein